MITPMLLKHVVLFCLCLSAAAAHDDAVQVNHPPANVQIRTFDPNNRPKDIPALEANEAAVTESVLACAVQVEVETTKITGEPAKSKIISIKADLRLDVTEWLP